jgi:magnesium transporter
MDFIVDQYTASRLVRGQAGALGTTSSPGPPRRRPSRSTGSSDLLEVKRAVVPLVDVCNRLVRADAALIPDDARVYFRDVYDHVIRINEMIDTLRELLTTALEANLSLISVSQNEAMKRLAAWAAIIAVPTMIAGVYGMNFKFMPELEWSWGYPVTMIVMVGACGFLYYRLKRAGWL